MNKLDKKKRIYPIYLMLIADTLLRLLSEKSDKSVSFFVGLTYYLVYSGKKC